VDRTRAEALARWNRQDMDEQRRRLRTTSLDDRLQEAIAWSAVLLADEIERTGRVSAAPHPVGLGSRRT
jgi:hypothetical protein